jgi:hypothetical protein
MSYAIESNTPLTISVILFIVLIYNGKPKLIPEGEIHMPDEMHWGPFTLQWSLLSFLVSLLAGYGLTYWRLRGSLTEGANKEILSIIGNGMFAFFLVWKFGAVLLDISLIWTRPLGILLYSGGRQETYYGIITAVLIILYSMRSRRISIRILADILPWGILGTITVYELCKWRYGVLTDVSWGIHKPGNSQLLFHPLNVYVAIAAVGTLLRLGSLKKNIIGSGLFFKHFSIYFGLGMLVVTFFMDSTKGTILTAGQIWLVLLVLSGIFSDKLLTFIDQSFLAHPNQRKEREGMEDTSINSPEQNSKTRKNEALDREKKSVFNHQANEKVDKKLDGPDRPAE